MKQKIIKVGTIKIGGKSPLVLIAGPCVIESEKQALFHAKRIKEITQKCGVPFIFKSSYDKANRSSIKSYRGPGLKKGLAILQKVKKICRVPVLTDVHSAYEAAKVGEVVDVLQIPAFLCRQTDLLIAAAQTGKVINVKKGQFLAPWDMKNIIAKIESADNTNIILTERGVSFGYNTLVSDFRSIEIMKSFGYPVIFDGTHSVQKPGGLGDKTGGDREYIPVLSKAAVASGSDGLFWEVHVDPDKAKSDGPNMVRLRDLAKLLAVMKKIRKAVI